MGLLEAYLRAVGAGAALRSGVEVRCSRGFVLASSASLILPAVLAVGMALNAYFYGLEFVISLRFALMVVSTVMVYEVTTRIVSERVSLTLGTLEDMCTSLVLTASGARGLTCGGGRVELRFRGQPKGACVVTLHVPSARVPISLRASQRELRAIVERLRHPLSELLAKMLDCGVRALELRGFRGASIELPGRSADLPGVWLRAEFVTASPRESVSCVAELVRALGDGEAVASLASAAIEAGVAECDVGGMYEDLLSYHETFFGERARAVLERLIQRASGEDRAPRDLAVVRAWRRMIAARRAKRSGLARG
ncbi:MAG: hypothetical protein DRJ56_02570 [Thermoprotei archaeon]|nr:MAG: hypothetical protein DRJ56_02570 [Thermoprotei archaeon]